MNTAGKKPELPVKTKPNLLSEAAAFKGEAAAEDLVKRLAARISHTEQLIDAMALNLSSPTRLQMATDDLVADARTRHRSLFRRRRR